MKFYGNGVVWDARKNKPLCKFVDGEFETSDSEMIEILKSNYRYEIEQEDDKIKPDLEGEPENNESVNPLRCEFCGFVSGTPAGFKAHERKHKKEVTR